MTKPQFKHEWIPLEAIKPHPKVQRQFRQAHADGLAANFDPDCFGELYVVPDPRRDGGYLVFDGQHRCAAAEKALGANQKVYCRVYEERSLEELAKITLGVNTQKAWRSIDRFIQRVNMREAQAIEIKAVLGRHGLRIGAGPGEGVVRASAACDWVIQKAGGASALERAISILSAAWDKEQDAYHEDLIRGVALLCNRYNGELSDRDLSAKLKKQSGPGRLLGRARDFAKVLKQSTARAAARVMANDYNQGRRSNRLPEWQ